MSDGRAARRRARRGRDLEVRSSANSGQRRRRSTAVGRGRITRRRNVHIRGFDSRTPGPHDRWRCHRRRRGLQCAHAAYDAGALIVRPRMPMTAMLHVSRRHPTVVIGQRLNHHADLQHEHQHRRDAEVPVSECSQESAMGHHIIVRPAWANGWWTPADHRRITRRSLNTWPAGVYACASNSATSFFGAVRRHAMVSSSASVSSLMAARLISSAG